MSPEELLAAYATMRRIRDFEERLEALVAGGELPGFLHLYIGQEAIAAAVCSLLGERDWVASHHRGHGHAIARGVALAPMMAELFGRATGVCRGKGGSMHVADVAAGMLGANGIVGSGIPLATGAALAARMRGRGDVAVAFFGDGACAQGQFHESLNIASLWSLPVLYVVENNGWGEFTPVADSVAGGDIAGRAAAYAMASASIDGGDFFAVREAASEAVERARRGAGPTLLECRSTRMAGHFIVDEDAYRDPDSVPARGGAQDPLRRFEERILDGCGIEPAALRDLDAAIAAELDAAVEAARRDPAPEAAELTRDVLAPVGEG